MVAPAIVVENQGVIDAFGRSRQLVRGNGWNVFFAVLLAFLILAAVYIVLAGLGSASATTPEVVGSVIASVIAAPVTALLSSILFFDLGGGTEAAAASEPTAPA